MSQIVITIPKFWTHVAKSKSTYLKINNQGIYSGNIHRFTRAKMVEDLHNYIGQYVFKYQGLNLSKVNEITYRIHTVINHGSISMRKTGLCWKKAKPGYIPTWDIENLASVWTKTGNDTLTAHNIIIDDNVSVIKKVSYEFVEVQDIDDRKIEIIIDY